MDGLRPGCGPLLRVVVRVRTPQGPVCWLDQLQLDEALGAAGAGVDAAG